LYNIYTTHTSEQNRKCNAIDSMMNKKKEAYNMNMNKKEKTTRERYK